MRAYLALSGLEAVHDRRDGAHVVGHGEEDEFLVDEIGIANGILGVVQEGTRLEGTQPILALFHSLLVEGHIDGIKVALIHKTERDLVRVHVGEVFFGLLRGACTETCTPAAYPGSQSMSLARNVAPPSSQQQ